MFLVAVACFRLLYQKWDESLKSSKVSSKVSSSASDVPLQSAVRPKKRAVHQAPTEQSVDVGFSEMILECGQMYDVDRARKLWDKAMATRIPDGATLLSMVEVLVTCKCTKEAWAITNSIWEDAKSNLQTNPVAVRVYSALLRVFSQGNEHEQVYALYLEMQQRMVPMSTKT